MLASSFKAINFNKLKKTDLDDSQYTTRNFSPYKIALKNNKLLLISTNGVGAYRKYYGFIPLGWPRAFCSIEGRLIDPSNNKILWRDLVTVKLEVKGEWNQPPRYPNFSKTLQQAIAKAKQKLLGDFFASAPH